MPKTKTAEMSSPWSQHASRRVSGNQLKLRRLWVWPLRTGLMIVLAVGGLSPLFIGGCGGSVASLPPEAEGGNSGTPQAGGATHNGGTTGNTMGFSMGGGTSGQGGSFLATQITLPDSCMNDSGATQGIFATQVFSMNVTRPKVLYSWTTTQQAEELRNGSPLFSRSERPDLGRGNALEALAKRATGSDALSQLAGVLSQKVFATARYAWTNPWATRLGWPGEQYGNQLLRIELQDDAWYALFDGQNLWVMDSAGQYVSIDEATANPTRVAAIVYTRGPSAGGPLCGGSFGEYTGAGRVTGTGAASNAGYREIVLGNIGMVKRWSIGTAEIAARLNEDIELLEAFNTALPNCPPMTYDSDWNGMVVCGWTGHSWLMHTDYVNALAIPSDYYQPTSENIRRIIDTLKSDGFVIDPYVSETVK